MCVVCQFITCVRVHFLNKGHVTRLVGHSPVTRSQVLKKNALFFWLGDLKNPKVDLGLNQYILQHFIWWGCHASSFFPNALQEPQESSLPVNCYPSLLVLMMRAKSLTLCRAGASPGGKPNSRQSSSQGRSFTRFLSFPPVQSRRVNASSGVGPVLHCANVICHVVRSYQCLQFTVVQPLILSAIKSRSMNLISACRACCCTQDSHPTTRVCF